MAHSSSDSSKTDLDNHCPSCGTEVSTIAKLQKLIAKLHREVDTLKQQALTDTLTGLYNYRHFTDTLSQEMERTQRTGNTTGLIMVDLDFFKKVNDTYGHEIGNQVLIHVAHQLKAAIRKLDTPCRYGGEEFAIILPSTDLLTSTQVARRLCELIEKSPLQTTNETIQLTASIGVDVYSPFHSEEQEDFIQRVDALLYEAKNGGRNRVCSGRRSDLTINSTVSSDEKDALNSLFGNVD